MDPTATPLVPSLNLFSLAGKNVLITGATRGIGAACAIALAEAGASVCLVQRQPPPGHEPNLQTYNAIRALGANADTGTNANADTSTNANTNTSTSPNTNTNADSNTNSNTGATPSVAIVECDLSDLTAVKQLFQKALDVMGGQIHILVNCAGIQRRSPSLEFSEGDWDDVLTTNLKSIFLLSQSAGRHMVPLRRGKIINFCSLLTFQGGITVPAYAAAKGALGQLTKALSNEWSVWGVQVNGVCPGYVGTDMNAALLTSPPRLAQITSRIPAGRWGEPRDFAGPVVFLASAASQYVCGELVVVDGGWMGR